eukprot:SAG31_NODE_2197_length_6216_cov_4.189962_6_plen_240_part_00
MLALQVIQGESSEWFIKSTDCLELSERVRGGAKGAESTSCVASIWKCLRLPVSLNHTATAYDRLQNDEPDGYHVVISYRRTHSGWAFHLKDVLEQLGLSVFVDADGGIGACRDFQAQLENIVRATPVLIALVTPAPSGEQEDPRNKMSSMEAIKYAAAEGQLDYVSIEMRTALESGKLVVPVYLGSRGTQFIGRELQNLEGLGILEQIKLANAFALHEEDFRGSVQRLAEALRMHMRQQ